MVTNTKTVLHLFKAQPCALFVLIALCMDDCPDPCGEKWLARRTGYTRKSVRESGLYFLEDLELVHRVRRRRGWSLTASARQLPLPFPKLNGSHAGNVLEGELSTDDGSDGDEEELSTGEGKVYPHGATTTTTAAIGRESEATRAAAADQVGEGKVYPHGEGKVYPHDVIQALKEAGIGAPTCDELAELGWVTVEYVEAHVAQGLADGDSLGLIIHRMRSGDRKPDVGQWETCPECGRALFDARGRCMVCTGQVQI